MPRAEGAGEGIRSALGALQTCCVLKCDLLQGLSLCGGSLQQLWGNHCSLPES